jgi:hypothetical protein
VNAAGQQDRVVRVPLGGRVMGFVVSSTRETGTIRYFCATTGSALDKVHDFRRAEYRDITIATIEDLSLSEEELTFLARGERAPVGGTPAHHGLDALVR